MLSVHNTNWHEFNGPDDGAETCMTCGGTWEYDDRKRGKSTDRTYRAADGEAPSRCPGTSLVHGEMPCEADNGRGCKESQASKDGTCGHLADGCNCVYCVG